MKQQDWITYLEKHGFTRHIGFSCYWNFLSPRPSLLGDYIWYTKNLNTVIGIRNDPVQLEDHRFFFVLKATSSNPISIAFDTVFKKDTIEVIKILINGIANPLMLPLCLGLNVDSFVEQALKRAA